MKTLRALAISLFAHAALLGAAWSLTRGGNAAPEPALTVEAPLGDVFVQEESTAPAPGPANAAAAADSSLASPPSPPAAGASASAPGIPEGEAHPVGRILPVYPPMSRKLGEEGESVFVLSLRADGSVADLRLEHSSGHVRLDDAAALALRGARFEPASRYGAPVASEKRFRVEFRLGSRRAGE